MTGNPKLDKIIIIANTVVIGLACALVIYSHTMISAPPIDGSAAFGSEIEKSIDELQKSPVVFDEIVVNLYSREQRLRFLSTTLNIVLFSEKDRQNVLGLKTHVFDALIDIAGNMKPKELNSITGKLLLESRIKRRVNEVSGRQLVKSILFSKFIIQ